MSSTKVAGPKMDSWGTPALTACSRKEGPSRTTRSCVLLREDERKPSFS